MKRFGYTLLSAILMLLCVSAAAQDEVRYNASYFGAKSNGQIDNTASIQKAVDFIAEKGGGTLVFYVGRYLTGSVQLRSNVNIVLNEGAIIVGSDNIFDYRGKKAVFWGEGIENVTISGKGVIEGQGPALNKNLASVKAKGLVGKDVSAPALLYFKDCKNIKLQNFIFRYPATDPELYILENSDVVVDGAYCDTQR